MRTLICSFLSLLVVAGLSDCGPRDAAYDPSHFRLRGVLAPPEVLLPRGTSPGAVVGGLYTQSADDAGPCCLIAPHARFLVRKDGVATVLRIGVYVPATALFALHPQSLRVGFPSFGVTTVGGLLPGFHMLTVKVPAALRGIRGNVRVTLQSAVDYVPSAAGTGSNTPQDNLIMLSIYFE